MSVAMRPVVIAAGGTGGHIYPALAVASELDKHNTPVIWVGTREGLEARIVPAESIEIRWITVSGLRGKGMAGLFNAPFKLLQACWQSMRILREVGAGAVLGMGGFVSGPVGVAALCTRRPLILHEQNAVAGMTNRWLSRFATRVFTAMPNVFPQRIAAEAIGNPVTAGITALSTARASDNTSTTALHILVVGGSRGAHALNITLPDAIAALVQMPGMASAKIAVRHQTGASDEQPVRQAYAGIEAMPAQIDVHAYIDNMAEAYAWADVVICRSGAMTVSELSAAGLASILVPFPHAVDDHQTSNARYLSNAGAAILMPQQQMTGTALASELAALMNDRDRLARMASAARAQFKPDASRHLAGALMELNS